MDAENNLSYRSRYLLIPTIAVSMGLLSGRMKLGFAGRAIQITENDKKVNQFTDIGYRMNASEGFGFGLDAGMMFSFPWDYLPTIGVVARNIGNTNVAAAGVSPLADGTREKHGQIKSTYDVGLSFTPKLRGGGIIFGADFRDVTDVHGVDWERKINVGLEINLLKALFVRTGVSRGYVTGGIGLGGTSGTFDITTYGEELDPTKHHRLKDRRIAFRFGKRF